MNPLKRALCTAATAALLLAPGAASAATMSEVGGSTSYVDQVLALTNAQREAIGLPDLRLDDALIAAAQTYASTLSSGTCFDHTCDGTDITSRATDSGYTDWTALAENIASGQQTPQDVVDAWMASPAHKANILDPNVTEIGIGMVTGPDGKTYWVQDFGTNAPTDTTTPTVTTNPDAPTGTEPGTGTNTGGDTTGSGDTTTTPPDGTTNPADGTGTTPTGSDAPVVTSPAPAAGDAEGDDDGAPEGEHHEHPDNHGAAVSAVAHDHSVHGREHGQAVSAAAHAGHGHEAPAPAPVAAPAPAPAPAVSAHAAKPAPAPAKHEPEHKAAPPKAEPKKAAPAPAKASAPAKAAPAAKSGGNGKGKGR